MTNRPLISRSLTVLILSFILTAGTALTSVAQDQTQTTIVDLVEATPQLSTLNKALESTGMKEDLRTEEPITMLLPMNQAFEQLPQEQQDQLFMAENEDQLKKVLNNHIIEEEVTASDLSASETVETKEEEHTVDSSGQVIQVKQANLIQTDVQASNGVIHVVNQVLLPDDLE